MIALKLTDKKTFMNQLLCTDIFDHFLLPEVTIKKDAVFTIDGHINKGFYSEEELKEQGLVGLRVLPYSNLKPICYQMIRGRHTPAYFKFILMLSPENTSNILDQSLSGFTENDITGIFIKLTFHSGQIVLTTGVSYSVFSTNRTLEQEWDRLVQKFLYKHAIAYEEL